MRNYKVVCNDTDPDWLEKRHRYITASAIAGIAGASPWSSREALIAEKAGTEPLSLTDTPNMWHGREDESNNMRKFCKAMGFRYRATHLMLESSKVDRLSATLDGLVIDDPNRPDLEYCLSKDFADWGPYIKAKVIGSEGVGLLEMKQTESWGGKNWKDVAPVYYWWQVQAQLYVTGFDWAVIACQIGAAGFRAHYITPDEDAYSFIETEVPEFWKDVVQEEI